MADVSPSVRCRLHAACYEPWQVHPRVVLRLDESIQDLDDLRRAGPPPGLLGPALGDEPVDGAGAPLRDGWPRALHADRVHHLCPPRTGAQQHAKQQTISISSVQPR